ncbi:MAG: LTA synthase family protein [Bacilli bacterium]|nr:LTA synthase family protein [Bacilli bacterium]
MNKFKDKLLKIYKRAKLFSKVYLKTNVLFISYVLVSLFNATILRFYTVEKFWNIKPILADLAVILLIGCIGYFIKPKKQFRYFAGCAIVLTTICFVNSLYYTNYLSFASLSLLATSTQAIGVADAIWKQILQIKDFIYFVPLIIFFLINNSLKKHGYFEFVTEIEVGKVRAMNTAVAGLIVLGLFVSMLTATDLSRLKKQWNREYVVMQFGIYVYQFNDIVASLKPQISPLFGLDTANKEFRDYYETNKKEDTKNKYTNIYENKNVISIHAESIMNYLIGLEINGVEVTPNLNKLAGEGMYFSNFYAQESVGTSSDSEFTLNTSLMPASSGTVFVSYWDREYVTMPKLLKEKDYYTFSMHANNCTMWNRNNMHPSLGYDKFYCYTDSFTIDETIGLGLSDKSFFKQVVPIIEDINKNNKRFYGNLIMLTNHTPWNDIDKHSDFDVTMKYVDENGIEQTAPYLEGTMLGSYIKAVNYADQAIGQLINDLDDAGLLDDTVIVIYGDHDSKIKKSEYIRYYNYIPETNSIRDEEDPEYVNVDFYSYEINRSVPFIIWNKNDKKSVKVNEVMGMYDVMPTLGNMLNIYNPYALGNDIFSVDENVVIFPDGNWLTNKMYYNSQKEEGMPLNQYEPVSVDYINKYTKEAEEKISISDKIIVYDLIKKSKVLSEETE